MSTTETSTDTTLRGIDRPAPGTYTIDASHSNLVVTARHLMVSKVRGTFSSLEGTVEIAEDPLASSAQVVVQAATIDTRDEKRDEHLRAADFLDVEQYPSIIFGTTGVEQVKGSRFRLTGDLTVRNVTKSVTFDLEYVGAAKDPWGGDRLSFEARGEIDREEFGMIWNTALETGGVLVSKTLTFDFDVQAVKQ